MSDNGSAPQLTEDQKLIANLQTQLYQIEESFLELEIAMETEGWRRTIHEDQLEFSNDGRRRIIEMCRIISTKNPLFKRYIQIVQLYVWGQGFQVKATDQTVEKLIHDFLFEGYNAEVIGDHTSREDMQKQIIDDGDLFFVLFPNQTTGNVEVTLIEDATEITEVVCDPEDRRVKMFYKRVWTKHIFDKNSGNTTQEQRTDYYPDWRFIPRDRSKKRVKKIGQHRVHWDKPMMQMSINRRGKFGVSDTYSSIDWGMAYKQFLTDRANVAHALSFLAWQLRSRISSAKKRVAQKTKLNTTRTLETRETNPPPIGGSTFIGDANTAIQTIGKQGSTIHPDEGRRLLLMTIAGMGLAENMFGDINVGNLATAESLDRPTELMFRNWQGRWNSTFSNLIDFMMYWQVKAVQGKLKDKGTIERDGLTERVIWNKDFQSDYKILFPPVVVKNLKESIEAIAEATTLDGKPSANLMPDKVVSELILTALGVDNIDDILDTTFDDEGWRIKMPELPILPGGPRDNFQRDEGGRRVENEPASSNEPLDPNPTG